MGLNDQPAESAKPNRYREAQALVARVSRSGIGPMMRAPSITCEVIDAMM
jgi:hypothetical protein